MRQLRSTIPSMLAILIAGLVGARVAATQAQNPAEFVGDVDENGVVNSTDALVILSADADMDTTPFCPMNCGDANGDGLVNSTDALIVLSYDAGMTVPFPVGQSGCPPSVTQPPGCNDATATLTPSPTASPQPTGTPTPQPQFWIGDQNLRLDSQGHPHVAYVGDFVYYAWYDGEAWQIEAVAEGTAWHYNYFKPPPSLELDEQDTPHMTYLDSTGTTLLYAWRTLNGWETRTIDSAPRQYMNNTDTSLALDQEGNPQVAYNTGSWLRFASWSQGEWQIEVVDSSWHTEQYLSLAVDTNNAPHISYFWTGEDDHYELRYAHLTGSGWSYQTVDNSAKWLGEYNSLAVGSSGIPHIAYRDATNNQLKYACWSDGIWQIQTVEASPWWLGYTSTVIDSSGNPHISYGDDEGGKYVYWSGATWVMRTFDSDVGHTSLVLDANEAPHILYFDWADLSLTYAHWTGADWDRQVVDQVAPTGRHTAPAQEAGQDAGPVCQRILGADGTD